VALESQRARGGGRVYPIPGISYIAICYPRGVAFWFENGYGF